MRDANARGSYHRIFKMKHNLFFEIYITLSVPTQEYDVNAPRTVLTLPDHNLSIDEQALLEMPLT